VRNADTATPCDAAVALVTITMLTETAPSIAKAAAGISQTQALITGQKSHADRFEEGVVQFLFDQGSNATAWRVDAAFGVFGSLPLVGVKFDDAFVLLDATDGTLDGPFDLESPLDATILLAQHSGYVAGTSVRYTSFGGCFAVAAPQWRTTQPPGWTPAPVVPPATPTTPNGRPSHWTDWTCTLNAAGNCSCLSTGTGSGTRRPTIRTEVRCTCAPNPITGSCLGVGSGTHPNIPPTVTPGVAPGGGMTGCTCTQYWHY